MKNIRSNRLAKKFTSIYKKNRFNGSQSLSGNGSDFDQTETLRSRLPQLVQSLRIGTFLDIPCGDLFWMSKVDFFNVSYIGADIVSDLIKVNTQNYGSASKSFVELDLSKDVPMQVDFIFSRDLFVHLSTKDIKAALENVIRSRSTYFAMTTFTSDHKYKDLPKFTRGVGWRPINFESAPWNFPKPLHLINENCTEGNGHWSDKSIAVWRISDLPKIT